MPYPFYLQLSAFPELRVTYFTHFLISLSKHGKDNHFIRAFRHIIHSFTK